ncbi:MAG TPA: hypothetical protein VFV68_15410 [Agriterribacter sp.]|nr:hypothetical protein [Agriterribacter sp.]
MQPPGYSGTPLAKKLGIKAGFTVRLVHEPPYYFELFTDIPEDVKFLTEKKTKKNLVHYFTKKSSELNSDIIALRHEIHPNGMIWISWPKKASKIVTDLTEDVVRALALSNGLVDIKVCAVDETWSGLKLVIPVKDRKVG